jgi:hypothetical protein
MDWKAILPLIGVVLGWVLNQLSQFTKSRQEDKRLISETLYVIYDLLFTLEQTQSVLDGVIKSKRFTLTSEQIFESSLDEDILRVKTFQEKVDVAISNISKFDPIMAQRLRVFLSSSVSIFKTIEKIPKYAATDFKIQQIEVCYKTIGKYVKAFSSILMSLARRHGIILWFRFKFLIKQRSKRNPMEKGLWEDIFEVT